MRRALLFTLPLLIAAAIVIGKYSEKSDSHEAFAVIVLPDTQKYSSDYPDVLYQQMHWIVDNRKSLNIRHTIHVGDIVDEASDLMQWHVASDAFRLLDEANIPYSVIPGDNDITNTNTGGISYRNYSMTFPYQRFSSHPWYAGHFRNNQNSFQVLSHESGDWLFLNLEVDPDDDALQWASDVISTHQNYRTIVITHVYLNDMSGTRFTVPHAKRNGKDAESVWSEFLYHHCPIVMVLSGHSHISDGENMQLSTNACGNRVYQLVQNYQGRDRGGDGRLRIIRFSGNGTTASVQTYSPVTGLYELDNDSDFTVRW